MAESVVGNVQHTIVGDQHGFGFAINEPGNYRNRTTFLFRSREEATKARDAIVEALKTMVAVKLT